MDAELSNFDVNKPGKSQRDKRQKFVELAEKRTRNAIKAIRVVGKLGNKSHYNYEETDVKKIIGALNKEVETLRNRLSNMPDRDEIDFKL